MEGQGEAAENLDALRLREHLINEGVAEEAAQTLYDKIDYTCGQCNISIKGGLTALQNHLKRIDHKPPYKCGACVNTYSSRTALYQHLKDWHQTSHEGPILPLPPVEEESLVRFVPRNVPLPSFVPVPEEDNNENPMDRRDDVHETLKRSAELAVLKMRSITYMTGVAIEKVQDECFGLMKQTAQSLKGKVVDFLSHSNVPLNMDLLNSLLANFTLANPFDHIRTKPQQLAVFKERFGLMEAEEIFLGTRFDLRQHTKRARLEPTQVNRSFQYMSIIKILQCVMSDPYLRGLIMSERKSTDGYSRSFVDGSLFEELPQDLKGALRIILYIDDLELLQALSAKRGNYKMAGIYFGIQNLPPELNALLTYIFVTALAFAEDAKYEQVWEPLLKDMSKLENEGAEVIIDEQSFTFKAVLVAKIGDTLAAHEVLGFVGPSSMCFCRVCYIKRDAMWKDGTQLGVLRTPAQHKEDVKGCQNIVIRQATGVRAPSLITGLRFFEPVRNSIFDIFHDLPQGICKMEVKLALREYVCVKKYFTVQQMQSRIQFFDYGLPDKRNKPVSGMTADYLRNLDSYNLPQTGAQMWCLTRSFVFLFGDLVPPDDKFLKLISLLNQIMVIVFSHAICEYDLRKLDELVLEHHRLFMELFPGKPEPQEPEPQEPEPQAEQGSSTSTTQEVPPEDEPEEDEVDLDNDLIEVTLRPEEVFEEFDGVDIDSEFQLPSAKNDDTAPGKKKKKKKSKRKPKIVRMINKHHHMLHWSSQIRLFGPLILYWCMRYEAQHYVFKLTATVSHNFLNVLKTLMEMLQMKNAAEKNSPKSRMEIGKRGTKVYTVCDLPNAFQFVSAGIEQSSKIYKVLHVKFNGVDYREGLYVTLELSKEGSLPVFARIMEVYVSYNEDAVFLLIQECITECYEPLYCAYPILPLRSAPLILKASSEFPSYRVLAPWRRYDSDKRYLAPRSLT